MCPIKGKLDGKGGLVAVVVVNLWMAVNKVKVCGEAFLAWMQI